MIARWAKAYLSMGTFIVSSLAELCGLNGRTSEVIWRDAGFASLLVMERWLFLLAAKLWES